jgi:parallel beta-helix repeat protein
MFIKNTKYLFTFVFLFVLNTFSQTCTNIGDSLHPEWDCPDGSGADLFTRLNNAGENEVFHLRAGHFDFPGTVNIRARNIKIIGEGLFSTVIEFNGAIHGFDVNTGTWTGQVEFRNLTILRRNANHTNGGGGIILYNPDNIIENVTIRGFMEALVIRENNWSNKVIKCNFSQNQTGLYVSSGNANAVTISDCSFSDNLFYGIYIRNSDYPTNFRILNNAFQDNGRSGIYIESGSGIIIQNNYFESNEWQLNTAGNETHTEDAHILIEEKNGSQIRNIAIRDNYFNCDYAKATSDPVPIDGTKRLNKTTYQYLRPWRFKNTPLYMYSGVSGTTFEYSGNYYVKVDNTPRDNCICDYPDTCY